MATIDVSLPDKLKDWVEAKARSGQYTDASDYVCDLIRRDRERSESIAEVQALIEEGFASGVSERSMDEVLAEARNRTRAASTRGVTAQRQARDKNEDYLG